MSDQYNQPPAPEPGQDEPLESARVLNQLEHITDMVNALMATAGAIDSKLDYLLGVGKTPKKKAKKKTSPRR